ncbi:MAG: BMP family ABC transporter substrate-binding protein [Microbacterium arborescens]
MTLSTPKKLVGITAAAGLLVALAGCGSAPDAGGNSSAAPEGAGGDFLPCLVSDEGGWNDRSFNQSAKEGMDRAKAELGVEAKEVESTTENDYAPNLDTLVAEGCDLIVAVGYKLAPAVVASATANPEIDYAIVDDYADTDFDGKTDAPNIKPLVFNTAEAAYLGGYAAASWSAAAGVNKVGTFGGDKFNSVTVFMDGFQLGVEKYNEDKSANVGVVGWDITAQDGNFTGGFTANDTAKQVAQGILGQGVDVILPVGGPIYQSAAQAIREGSRDVVMLGVDSDLAVSDDTVADLTLVSIQKAIDVAVYDATIAAQGGDFDTTPYVGTLKNEGVKLSSFHDFESRLPAGLTDELTALQEAIVAGTIVVDSPNSP